MELGVAAAQVERARALGERLVGKWAERHDARAEVLEQSEVLGVVERECGVARDGHHGRAVRHGLHHKRGLGHGRSLGREREQAPYVERLGKRVGQGVHARGEVCHLIGVDEPQVAALEGKALV